MYENLSETHGQLKMETKGQGRSQMPKTIKIPGMTEIPRIISRRITFSPLINETRIVKQIDPNSIKRLYGKVIFSHENRIT